MDPITIATSIVTLLTPFVKKAMEEFSGKAGDAVFDKTRELYHKLKAKFTGDDFADGTLKRFEKDPDKYAAYLEDVVQEQLQKNEDLSQEFAQLLEQIQQLGPTITVVQKMIKARNVTGVDAGDIIKGSVDVQQGMDDAENVTGVKVTTVGNVSRHESKKDTV